MLQASQLLYNIYLSSTYLSVYVRKHYFEIRSTDHAAAMGPQYYKVKPASECRLLKGIAFLFCSLLISSTQSLLLGGGNDEFQLLPVTM